MLVGRRGGRGRHRGALLLLLLVSALLVRPCGSASDFRVVSGRDADDEVAFDGGIGLFAPVVACAGVRGNGRAVHAMGFSRTFLHLDAFFFFFFFFSFSLRRASF
jgi:hypothetical protein